MKFIKGIPLTILAILTMTSAGQSFAATHVFADLNHSAASSQIQVLQEKRIVKGVSDQCFAPETQLTAAEGVQLIVNALKLNIDHVRFIKEPLASDYFKKANNEAWYADAFIIAAINGLELPADLDPAEFWTKEEFTYQLISAMEKHNKLPMIKLLPVAIGDEKELTPSYQGAIQRALHYGIASLDEKGNFHPQDHITREDAAILIYNALKYLDNQPESGN
ncbi:S-layer homology domain-containing protein [Brevibacillus sp. SYSU BS000544]|uniref:S-layer homology domain-containing protein n=1 Tax=Brevibacillus sp. SYSU BS000544 TaxID=3416443 RepID=UPI003CE559B0